MRLAIARKLRTARQLMLSEGPGLGAELLKRTARILQGKGIDNHFARFAYFRHTDGERIALYSGYRDYLKPLHVLSHTDETGLARYVADNREAHVEAMGLGGALNFLDLLRRDLGIEVTGKRILDVGCGDGALAFVLAAQGAAKVDGIELQSRPQSWESEYQRSVIEAVVASRAQTGVPAATIRERTRLFEMDVQHAATDDHYDLIISNSVLEHITDLRAGLRAMAGLLTADGVMVHLFNPFFSENGGHEWCILDFPWGHVRLGRDEIVQYLATYRGWEQERALADYDGAFNNPKLTLREIDAFADTLSLRQRRAWERRSFWWTPATPSDRIVAQCRRSYPTITWRDLTADSVLRVWSAA